MGLGLKSDIYDSELAIKLTVDLHRPQPKLKRGKGNNLCFGQMVEPIPSGLLCLPQLVSGRLTSQVLPSGNYLLSPVLSHYTHIYKNVTLYIPEIDDSSSLAISAYVSDQYGISSSGSPADEE